MSRTVAFHNLGCKVNAYEMEAMQQELEEDGYQVVPFSPGADVYIINTCTVTNIADRKSRQMLHKARKMNPHAVVIAAGCYVQTQGEKVVKDPAIDIVLGNNEKHKLTEILKEYKNADLFDNKEKTDADMHMIDINHTSEYEPLSIARTGDYTRAYIKVQDGCDQFCSYCIIPFARGRVRSRQKKDIIEECRRLAKNGHQEMVLTGIHLSSYGKDFEEKDSFLDLIRAVCEIDEVKRVRLGSLEPRIITEEFAKAISSLDKVCPHFHLSLQSGCDATLVRMNRKYTSREYMESCRILRNYYENPALTTDIIVGFPGETSKEFEESKAFVESIHFFETHVFKYSKREGTKAAAMPCQIPENVKHERSQILIALDKKRRVEYMDQFAGKRVEVLFEELQEIDNERYYTGYTREYIRAAVKSETSLSGTRVPVIIHSRKDNLLLGETCH